MDNRFLDEKRTLEESRDAYIKEFDKRYSELAKSIADDIDKWFDKYASNEQITNEEAYQLLSKREQRNWSMTLDEYRKKAIEGGYTQELNAEYYKSRISRAEQLMNQLRFELTDYSQEEVDRLNEYLKEHFEESYLRNLYELSDRGSFSVDFNRYNSTQLQMVIRKPWKGSTFFDRLSENITGRLPDSLTKVFTQGIVNGWSIDKMTDALMKEVTLTTRNRIKTLIRTESAHLAEQASQVAYKQTKVKKWKWLATLETSTCSLCGKLDGQIFDTYDKDAPSIPLHPNCRCTSVPVVEGFENKERHSQDGFVKDMTFEEWKKQKLDL